MTWVVVVERLDAVVRGRFTGTRELSTEEFTDRSEAREKALRLTAEFEPERRSREQERRAYRISADEYLVETVGVLSKWHFRVTVAERIVPGSGDPYVEAGAQAERAERPFPGIDL